MKPNRFVKCVILLLFLGGLVLLAGRIFYRSQILRMIVTHFSPDHLLEENGLALAGRLLTALAAFHLCLGLIGAGLLNSRTLGALPALSAGKGGPSSRNLLILSTLAALYLAGMFIITKSVAGVRLPIYYEDGLFESLSFISYFGGAAFFLAGAWQAQAKNEVNSRRLIPAILILFAILSIFLGGEEVSWGQRLIGWKTPESIALRNYQGETNLHNLLSPLHREQAVLLAAVGLDLVLFGVWLGFWKQHQDLLEGTFPHPAMFVLALFLGISSSYNEELFEELLSAFSIIYAVWIWNVWRLRSRPAELGI